MRLFLPSSSDLPKAIELLSGPHSCLEVGQTLDRRVGVNDTEWEALTCQMVFDALQHQWAAMPMGAGPDFFGRHPDGAFDAFVKLAAHLQLAQ